MDIWGALKANSATIKQCPRCVLFRNVQQHSYGLLHSRMARKTLARRSELLHVQRAMAHFCGQSPGELLLLLHEPHIHSSAD